MREYAWDPSDIETIQTPYTAKVTAFIADHLTCSFAYFPFCGAVGEPRVTRKRKAITVEQNAATIRAVAAGAELRGTDAIKLFFFLSVL